MNALMASVLVLCLCLCPGLAFAQGDPGAGGQRGLDVFFPGMSKVDAKKMGATPAGENQMQATVIWGGKKWNVVLLGKGKAVSVVGLSAQLAGKEQVATMLRDMAARLAVPMLLTTEEHGEKKEENFLKQAASGKDKRAREAAVQEALDAFAGRKTGTLTVLFCPEAMFDALAGMMRTTGDLDGKKIMAAFGDTIVYSLHMNKQEGAITVVASTFAGIRKL